MTRYLLLGGLAVLAATNRPAGAQEIRLLLGGGRTMYDAAGDQFYPMFRLGIQRDVTGALRLGVTTSWTDVERESLWRVVGSAAFALRLSEAEDLRGRITPWLEGNLGIVHSAGVRVRPGPVDPDDSDRTGAAFGAGLGIDVTVSHRLGIRGSYHLWQDDILGKLKFNTEEFVGLVITF